NNSPPMNFRSREDKVQKELTADSTGTCTTKASIAASAAIMHCSIPTQNSNPAPAGQVFGPQLPNKMSAPAPTTVWGWNEQQYPARSAMPISGMYFPTARYRLAW